MPEIINFTQTYRWDRGKIHASVVIMYRENLKLGENSFLNEFCAIDATGGVEIGDNVWAGPHIQIHSLEHNIKPDGNICTNTPILKKVTIGNDVWIGGGAIITAGVTIGNHVVIGVGAIVTHDIPDWEIWAGNPAKKIGDRRTWTGLARGR
jgi:maltose O-acetyltransferase